MRNSAYFGNTLMNQAVEGLRSRLPNGWRLTLGKLPRGRTFCADAQLSVRGPDGTSAVLLVIVKPRVSPRQAAEIAAEMAEAVRASGLTGALLISNYLSDLSCKRIRMANVNYYDLTGNAWITIKRPGLLIETQGSDRDPSPPRRGVRSLKGTKAARIVRELCDTRPPIGVRELARLTGSNPGHVSRVVSFLASEDLIRREEAGEIVETNWQDLIRRWSQDYSVIRTNRAVPYLVPRGLSFVMERLRTYGKRYALTGNTAVPAEALIASGRLVTCYVDEMERAAGILDARPAETGANVLLLEPFDQVVYNRARIEDGLIKVALSQCTVDLLTGGGRGPSEADALLEWMARNEDAWRS